MIVRNNASAVKLFTKIIDSSAENLTGLKQSTDIVLVKFKLTLAPAFIIIFILCCLCNYSKKKKG